MQKVVIVFFMLLSSYSAFSDQDVVNTDFLKVIDEINNNPNHKDCVALESEVEKFNCLQAYNKLFEQDNIEIGIFLGYTDSSGQDFVADFGSRIELDLLATQQCVSNTFFCGFKRDEDNAYLYHKKIKGPLGKEKKVTLKIRNSAARPSQAQNTKTKKGVEAQKKKTEEVWKEFEKSLKNDEMVFYIGHARYGTGPDFGPFEPVSVDAVERIFKKENLKRMKKALESAEDSPKVIGLISCQASLYYGKEVHQSSPESAIYTTNQTTSFSDAIPLTVKTIDGLLGQKCKEDMNSRQVDGTSVFYVSHFEDKSFREKLPSLNGFFEGHPRYEDPPVVSQFIALPEGPVLKDSELKLDETIEFK